MSYCPECYAEIEPDAKFCRSCGARMGPGVAKPAKPPTPPPYQQLPTPSPYGPRPYRSEEGLTADQAIVLLCCGGVAGAAAAWVIFSALDEPKKAQHACYIALAMPVALFLFYFLAIMAILSTPVP
ncbi:MAG: zinc ribbon domain-containing protein [Candidatus Hodarchaeota archaeon]